MDKTISQIFQEFLADQQAKLSPKTFSKYCDIIGLFKNYLESYWPGHDQEEYDRITEAGGTFCDSFGPAEILEARSTRPEKHGWFTTGPLPVRQWKI